MSEDIDGMLLFLMVICIINNLTIVAFKMSHPTGCISQAIENTTLALLSIARAEVAAGSIGGNTQPTADERDALSAAFATAKNKAEASHACLHRAYTLINDPKFQLKAFHNYNETSAKIASAISRIDYALELIKREYIVLEGEMALITGHIKRDLKKAKELLQAQLKTIKNSIIKLHPVEGPAEIFIARAESAWNELHTANKTIAAYFDQVINRDVLLKEYSKLLELVQEHLKAAQEALQVIEEELQQGNYPITSDKVRELSNIAKGAMVTCKGLIDWPETSELSDMQLRMMGELKAGVSTIYNYGTELILKSVREKVCRE